MEKRFKRLTIRERELIGRYHYENYTQTKIAKLIGVHKSTISRELKRNKFEKFYIPLIAQDKNDERRKASYTSKIIKNIHLLSYIEEYLKVGWSPELIAGRSKLYGNPICHETIYSYIFSKEGISKKLYTYLHSRRPKRFPKIARKKNKRSLIPNRISIHDRPNSINTREEFGHWEADLIVFSKDRKANIFTMRERKSRFLIALKNDNRSPVTITKNLLENEKFKYLLKVKTITFDNDIAFTKHEKIAENYSAKTYFCDPFKSYQKGGIENANKMLRRYCPRKIDIANLHQNHIDSFIEVINDRPMKCLGYKTPREVYLKLAVAEIQKETLENSITC